MRREVLQFQNLKIKVRGRVSLRQIYFQLLEGEVNGIVFQNTEEQRDMLDFFMGKGELEAGSLFLNGEKMGTKDGKKKIAKCTAVVGKKSVLSDTVSVVENLYINADKAFSNQLLRMPEALKLFEKFQITIFPGRKVSELTPVERVMLEILRAYIDGKSVVVINNILDTVSQRDIKRVLSLIYLMTAEKMSFILMEQIEESIFQIHDQIFYIKNGCTIGNFLKGSFDLKSLKKEILFKIKDAEEKQYPKQNLMDHQEPDIKPRLEIKKIHAEGIHQLSFSAYKGELVKIFFLQYSNCNEFVQMLLGANPLQKGMIMLDGREVVLKNEGTLVRQGIAVMDHMDMEGHFFPNLTVFDNVGLMVSHKVRNIWLRKKYSLNLISMINRYMGEGLAEIPAGQLSKENQLRLMYVMWLAFRPKVIFLVNPFSGQDIELQNTVSYMIDILKQNDITVILLLSNYLTLDKFEGDTVLLCDGEQVDEAELHMLLYG